MKSCSCCRIVQFVAFWEALSEAKWKRPVLFICSLILGGFASWVQFGQEASEAPILVSVLPAVLGCLGMFVALKRCNACVARLLGSA